MTGDCRWCGRTIQLEDGRWIDPQATGDDVMWRETCDEHDTFTAEHEPTRPTAEDKRRAAHQHFDPADGHNHPAEATCGSCGRSWCFTCGPTPASLCPFDNGDPATVARAGIRKVRSR